MQLEFVTNFEETQGEAPRDHLLCQSCSLATARPVDWTWQCKAHNHATIWKSEWDRDQERGSATIGERELPQRAKPHPMQHV